LGQAAFGGCKFGVAAVVALGAAQDGAGVGNFPDEDVAGNGSRCFGVVGRAVLFAAEQHVPGNGALDAGEEFAVLG